MPPEKKGGILVVGTYYDIKKGLDLVASACFGMSGMIGGDGGTYGGRRWIEAVLCSGF